MRQPRERKQKSGRQRSVQTQCWCELRRQYISASAMPCTERKTLPFGLVLDFKARMDHIRTECVDKTGSMKTRQGIGSVSRIWGLKVNEFRFRSCSSPNGYIPAELNAGVIVAPKAKQNPPKKSQLCSNFTLQTTHPSDQTRRKRRCFQE